MAIEIKMPALSPTMTTGTLAKWLVGEGDQVNSGDVIAEIETDKATMEVESVDDGIMAKILVDAGAENVAVGAVIAVLAEDGETASDVAKPAFRNHHRQLPVPTVVTSKRTPVRTSAAAPVAAAPLTHRSASPPQIKSSDKPRDLCQPAGARGLPLIGILRLMALPEVAPMAGFCAVMLSPPPPPQSRKQSQHPAGVTQAARLQARPNEVTAILLPIARCARLLLAAFRPQKQQAPHFYLTVDCVIDNLLEARKVLNAKAAEGIKISVNDMIIRAAAMALISVPEANASWEGENTRLFRHADIAMAVAIDGGLITPIVWAAEQKGTCRPISGDS